VLSENQVIETIGPFRTDSKHLDRPPVKDESISITRPHENPKVAVPGWAAKFVAGRLSKDL
jgi:hypothetical protein